MSSRASSETLSPDEFVERLKRLVAAQIAGSNQLLTRFGDFAREASKAVGGNPTGERASAQTLLSRWLDFNLASYSVVTTNSLALLNDLLGAAESTLIPRRASSPSSPASRVELRLSGRHGERASSGFVLENHYDRPLEITFQAGDLVPQTGPSLPASHVSFEQRKLVISPHGQAVVQVAVSITPDFAVGQTYTTSIRLLGFEAKEVGLSVAVLPAADGQEPSGPTPKRSQSAKKRRARA